MRNRRFVLGLAFTFCLAAALVVVPPLVAQSADGVVANFTSGKVKLLHTGGSLPNSQYADLGRLTLPVGSWAVTAHTDLMNASGAPTGVDCYLVGPGGFSVVQAHTPIELPGAKGQNIKDLTLLAALTAPSGGSIDVMCKVSATTADRKVFAQDTGISAVSVSGATVTHTPAPALGTY
jgi:hypothetical protein